METGKLHEKTQPLMIMTMDSEEKFKAVDVKLIDEFEIIEGQPKQIIKEHGATADSVNLVDYVP